MHVVINTLVNVNVGLTTVATVTTRLFVSWCIPDVCLFNSSG